MHQMKIFYFKYTDKNNEETKKNSQIAYYVIQKTVIYTKSVNILIQEAEKNIKHTNLFSL